MDKNNNNKKPVQIIRNELKYLIFIILFVAGILINYLTVSNRVELNAYKITEIQKARAEAWNDYDINYDEQIKYLQDIREDVIKIKLKLNIE